MLPPSAVGRRSGGFADLPGESAAAMDPIVDVLVETTQGSKHNYEYDRRRQALRLDRRLCSAVSFPADYGFVAGTEGADGEPPDALGLLEDPTFPGCWVRARVVGVCWSRGLPRRPTATTASRPPSARSRPGGCLGLAATPPSPATPSGRATPRPGRDGACSSGFPGELLSRNLGPVRRVSSGGWRGMPGGWTWRRVSHAAACRCDP